MAENVKADHGEWRSRAICDEAVAYLFFSSEFERQEAKEYRENLAAALCAICPVIVECRTFARENREYGFWGGESEDERIQAGYGPSGRRRRTA